MNVPADEPLDALIEDYLNGLLDEPRMLALEDRLRADPAARGQFVRYTRMHTDLLLGLRARKASARVLDAIGLTPVPSRDPGSKALFLVRDPATFTEPPILNLPGQAAGWVRIRRVTPGTHVANIPGQWVYGDCELIGDEAIIRQLLER